jgi:hypothetical protein
LQKTKNSSEGEEHSESRRYLRDENDWKNVEAPKPIQLAQVETHKHTCV